MVAVCLLLSSFSRAELDHSRAAILSSNIFCNTTIRRGTLMLRIIASTLIAFFAVAQGGAWAAEGAGKTMTIVGDVFDSSCLFTKNLSKPISSQCALECAAGGSPLVILGTDGMVYWPIDKDMPARGQNYKLIKFAGKTVTMTGVVYERGSSKAIVIQTIESAPAKSK